MEITEKHKREIEKIINENPNECPKDFECYSPGLENLCKAKDIGLKSFVQCLERPGECEFSFSVGGSERFCDCVLRVYIAKELGR